MFDAYAQADMINNKIIKLYQKNKIKNDNTMEWLLFTRTIKTCLDLIDYEAKQHLNFEYGFVENEVK